MGPSRGQAQRNTCSHCPVTGAASLPEPSTGQAGTHPTPTPNPRGLLEPLASPPRAPAAPTAPAHPRPSTRGAPGGISVAASGSWPATAAPAAGARAGRGPAPPARRRGVGSGVQPQSPSHTRGQLRLRLPECPPPAWTPGRPPEPAHLDLPPRSPTPSRVPPPGGAARARPPRPCSPGGSGRPSPARRSPQ